MRLNSWRNAVRQAIERGARTPFQLFALQPLRERVEALERLNFGLPARCWLSFKTQPLAPLVRWWIREGRPVEVVSEFEFRSALAEGCPPERLLANGPAKHRWLPLLSIANLQVNFDSLTEIEALAPLAKRLRWRTGLRIRTAGELDPEHAACPTQFGLEPAEIPAALRTLRRQGVEPEIAHTHIRTNVPDPSWWTRATDEMRQACQDSGWHPSIVDLGGGLPAPATASRSGGSLTASYDPGLARYADHLRAALKRWAGVGELWLEHGRHVSAGAGALVIRILDSKIRGGRRMLICDGGRTLNAMVSLWEEHALLPLQTRRGRRIPTVVHGPTCMAFDQLGCRELPQALQAGDILLWMEAGAYHLPWETRFSHGLSEVWWDDGEGPVRVRKAEDWSQFWGQWEPADPRFARTGKTP